MSFEVGLATKLNECQLWDPVAVLNDILAKPIFIYIFTLVQRLEDSVRLHGLSSFRGPCSFSAARLQPADEALRHDRCLARQDPFRMERPARS